MAKKIVVVDDEEAIRDALNDVLTSSGYQVILAADGKEGAEKVKSEKPDLIISDLMMPGVSGGKMASVLEGDAATKNIPIIFLTGVVNDEEAKLTGHKMAGQYLLAKPFDNNELLAMVDLAMKK
ncbi:MAG: response regulator [Candidatus Omnitrophica bacterium]|nr:response regulator [Candidatus Omnitrophota bacterium]